LYATGEVTASVHGANRLGGNSLAEGQVFGRRTGLRSAADVLNVAETRIAPQTIDAEIARIQSFQHRSGGEKLVELLDKIKNLMWNNVGIVRDAEKLQVAEVEIGKLQEAARGLSTSNLTELQSCLEIQDMLQTAEAIVVAAQIRKESRG